MKNAVTLKDIARETGVHVSTVSRALSPNAQNTLTEQVIKRVRETAERLGYVPNRLASGLRTNRTMTVGMMIPDITNAVFPPMVRGVESVLEPMGYASIIVNTDSQPEREHRLANILRERGVDGLIHAAVLRNDPKIDALAAQGTPVVTANRSIDSPDIPAVVNDDAHGIHLMLRHLHEFGHRRIAHIAGPQELSTGQIRYEAYLDAARGLGLDPPATSIAMAARFDEKEGYRCAQELLDSGPPFTAILCANDRLALGAIGLLRARGIDCPGQISVTGFNDMPMLDLISPPLTTIRIQQFEVGQVSARILLQIMTEKDSNHPKETVLPVQLIRRKSVAPAG
jgi:LacI family transcriptional regulator